MKNRRQFVNLSRILVAQSLLRSATGYDRLRLRADSTIFNDFMTLGLEFLLALY